MLGNGGFTFWSWSFELVTDGNDDNDIDDIVDMSDDDGKERM